MTKYNGMLAIDVNSISNVKVHRIQDVNEVAYSFTTDGEDYCLLADSIGVASIVEGDATIDTAFAGFWVNNAEQGCVLSFSELADCYEEAVTVGCAFNIFENKGFLLDPMSHNIAAVPDSESELLKRFYFGDSNFSVNTMTDNFSMLDICNSNGTYKFQKTVDTSTLADKSFEQSDFSFSESGSVQFPNGIYGQANALMYRGKVLNLDDNVYILESSLLLDAITLQYISGTFAFVDLQLLRIMSLDKKRRIFYKNGFLYVITGATFFRIKCDTPVELRGGVKKITLCNGDLKCADENVVEVTFHVADYQLVSKDGVPVRWIGEPWTFSEIVNAGLDSDGAPTDYAQSNVLEAKQPKENDGAIITGSFVEPTGKDIELTADYRNYDSFAVAAELYSDDTAKQLVNLLNDTNKIM